MLSSVNDMNDQESTCLPSGKMLNSCSLLLTGVKSTSASAYRVMRAEEKQDTVVSRSKVEAYLTVQKVLRGARVDAVQLGGGLVS